MKFGSRIFSRKGLIVITCFGVLGIIVGLCYSYYLKSTVEDLTQVYIYHNYYGPANNALFVESRDQVKYLVDYYKKVEQGDTSATFSFRLRTHPSGVPVYLVSFSSDSSYAEVISLYEYSNGSSYTRCFVYGPTVHNGPPQELRR